MISNTQAQEQGISQFFFLIEKCFTCDIVSQNKTGREPRRELSRYQVIIIPYSRGAGREVGRVKLVEKLAEKK